MSQMALSEIEFAALMVSRVCHDLVGPLGAVVNGLEVLEDERDAAMRADAIKLVTSSADQALARIQFMRIAFGAAEPRRAPNSIWARSAGWFRACWPAAASPWNGTCRGPIGRRTGPSC